LTTGASSTSDVASSSVVSLTSSTLRSLNSKSSPTMFSIVSVVVALLASTRRVSLSYSATIQSTPIWVANLIFSAACWSDGSAVATISRLLRLLSTTTRKAWHIFGSRSLGRRVASTASRSSSGAPNAVETVWARSAAETAPSPVSSARKLLRLLCALREISSADFCPSLPAEISARARPGSAVADVSETTESAVAMRQAVVGWRLAPADQRVGTASSLIDTVV
jgi:hypothetical protein